MIQLTPKDIILIFECSKANDALYLGELLPVNRWDFPRGTWLQQRLEQIRKEQGNAQD